MKRYSLVLSIVSGFLLWLSWPVSPFTLLIFVAFVPLLLASDHTEKKSLFFMYSFVAMLIWNTGTTWWIWNSTDVGAIGAIVANSLLMTLPWFGYRVFTRKLGQSTGLFSLVVFWMSFEYVHLNWQLSWPWLTLGNVFAMHPAWVQWYEVTGTSGGTLWVWLVNIFIFLVVKDLTIRKHNVKQIAAAILLFGVPLCCSLIINNHINTAGKSGIATNNVIIVQPNIDPYTEKFDESSINRQITTLLTLSEKQLDTNTTLVIWPETALSASVLEDQIQNSSLYKPVFDFVNRHPSVTLLTGIETYKIYTADKKTATAQLNENDGTYYDVLNAAVAIKKGEPLQFYVKGKLVPGVETLPDFLRWMGPVFEQFGGTAGGYGRSDSSSVFKEPGAKYVIAPIICYESIYGEYVSTYVKKGANLLTIITNDGWWKNTPGHKQHLQYARLRAIETRRYVARSANTGISAVIDSKGNILQTQPWDKAAFIKATIPALNTITFYVEWGDVLSKIALALGVLLIIFRVYILIKQRGVQQVKNANAYV